MRLGSEESRVERVRDEYGGPILGFGRHGKKQVQHDDVMTSTPSSSFPATIYGQSSRPCLRGRSEALQCDMQLWLSKGVELR